MDILNTKIKSILTEKNTKILPANIKSGVNILGVNGNYTGLDTSDATATASDIKTDKTAYVNGQKITGNFAGIVPSGTINILQNGTNIDVSQYASADVSVSGSGGKNVQYILGMFVNTRTLYGYSGMSITVAKTGTYTIKWLCQRMSQSGTSGTQIRVNAYQVGNDYTTWGLTYYINNTQNANPSQDYVLNVMTNVSLNENDVVDLYGKSNSNGNWEYNYALIIEEE